MTDFALHTLAVIGGAVVIIALALILYIAVGVLTVSAETVLVWLSEKAFRAGGGRTHRHPDGARHPDAPYDRIWIELLWLKRWAGWLVGRIGWGWERVDTPNRPDIERLHELRDEGPEVDSDA